MHNEFLSHYKCVIHCCAYSSTRLRRDTCAPPPLSASQTSPHFMGSDPRGGSLSDHPFHRALDGRACYACTCRGRRPRRPLILYKRNSTPPLCKGSWHFRKKMTEGLLLTPPFVIPFNIINPSVSHSLDSSLYTREPFRYPLHRAIKYPPAKLLRL